MHKVWGSIPSRGLLVTWVGLCCEQNVKGFGGGLAQSRGVSLGSLWGVCIKLQAGCMPVFLRASLLSSTSRSYYGVTMHVGRVAVGRPPPFGLGSSSAFCPCFSVCILVTSMVTSFIPTGPGTAVLHKCRGRAGDRSANGQNSGWGWQGAFFSSAVAVWVSTAWVTTWEAPFPVAWVAM